MEDFWEEIFKIILGWDSTQKWPKLEFIPPSFGAEKEKYKLQLREEVY